MPMPSMPAAAPSPASEPGWITVGARRMDWRLRLVFAVLIIALLALQYRLWVGDGSLADVSLLKQQLSEQQQALQRLEARNARLRAEVEDLRRGQEAIEARARSELGMIREGETFFQLVEPKAEGEGP